MQFLLHGPLAADVSPVGDALVRHEHKIHRPAELNLAPEAGVDDLLEAAAAKAWDIVTTDSLLALRPIQQKKWFPRCIVYLQLPGGDVEYDDAIDRLFTRFKRLALARLYTVTRTRVKVRQLPEKRP
jgi:hypothetical protein